MMQWGVKSGATCWKAITEWKREAEASMECGENTRGKKRTIHLLYQEEKEQMMKRRMDGWIGI